MRRTLIALIAVALSGCGIIFPSHAPVAVLDAPPPELPPGHSIAMGIKDNWTMDGATWLCVDDCGVGRNNEMWSTIFLDVSAKYPFLKNPVPYDQRKFIHHDYLLILDINIAGHHSNWIAIPSLLTFTIFPHFGITDVTVTARLTTPDENLVISEHKSVQKVKSVEELFLLFYAPFHQYFVDQDAIITELFSDPLNKVSNDFKDYLAKQAASPEPVIDAEHN